MSEGHNGSTPVPRSLCFLVKEDIALVVMKQELLQRIVYFYTGWSYFCVMLDHAKRMAVSYI